MDINRLDLYFKVVKLFWIPNVVYTIPLRGLMIFYLSLGLKRLSQAEEYLSQAKWTVVKTPECKNEIKSQLYRNLGMLHATRGNTKEALHDLAEDVRMYERHTLYKLRVYI